MGAAHRNVWMLAAATIATLAVIVVLGGRHDAAESAVVLRSAPPSATIYQRDPQLEQLPALFAVRRRMAVKGGNAEVSAEVARLSLELFQATGNARFLGAAESAIAAWNDVPRPPPAVWLLRGRIQQTQHYFAAAARDLSVFNTVHPGLAEGLLLEADAWRRAGAVDRSRRACMRLALHGRLDLATFCSAETLLSVGRPREALALVEPVINSSASLPRAERAWTLAIHADALSASGDADGAAAVWSKLLKSGSVPVTYKLAYADVLLSLARYQAVLDLLGDDAHMTASLLRVSVAATRLGRDNAASLRAALQARLYPDSRPAPGDLHLREQALHALWLEGDAKKSLALAFRNWEQQKGWEDTALLLGIADQLNRDDVIARVRDWQQRHSGVGSA